MSRSMITLAQAVNEFGDLLRNNYIFENGVHRAGKGF